MGAKTARQSPTFGIRIKHARIFDLLVPSLKKVSDPGVEHYKFQQLKSLLHEDKLVQTLNY